MQYQKYIVDGGDSEFGQLPPVTGTTPEQISQANIDAVVAKSGDGSFVIGGRALDAKQPTQKLFSVFAFNGNLIAQNILSH